MKSTLNDALPKQVDPNGFRRNSVSSDTLGPSTSKPSLSAISPATSALPGNLRQQPWRSGSTFASNLASTFASNFGAPGQPSPATSALPVNLASNLGARGQPSPATSVLPVNLASNTPCSRSTIASNLGAPGQPRQQSRRSRSTSPATSALAVNLASNLGARGQPRQQPRRSRSTTPATSALPVNVASNLDVASLMCSSASV